MRRGLVRLGRIDQCRHHHDAIETDARRFFRHVDRERRREFGDAAQDRHATPCDGFRRLHHRDLLVLSERAVLAHRAADDKARHPIPDQALDDARGAVDVERQIFAKLCRHRRKNAAPVRFQLRSPGYRFPIVNITDSSVPSNVVEAEIGHARCLFDPGPANQYSMG